MEPSERRGEMFFGWWIVLALFWSLVHTTGMGFYVFPVFIGSLQAEFGWSMTQISTGVAISTIAFGVSGPVIGVLIGRFGIRATMLGGALLASLCNLGYAAMQELWMLYAIMATGGFAIAGSSILPAQTTITNWFDRYRGRAMALAFLGPGAGGFLLPPLNELLIRLWGWRLTWVFASVVLWLLVVPVIAIFVRTRPSDMALERDGAASAGTGEGENGEGETAAPPSGIPVGRAVASPTFGLLVVVLLLQFTVLAGLNFHFVPFVEQEAGFSSQQAAFYFGLTVGFSLAGRLLAGWLSDRIEPQRVLALSGLLMACGPAALELCIVHLGLRDADLLWLHAVPYGIGFGALTIIFPVLVGRCFGELHFAKINGILGMAFAIGPVVGVPLAGNIFDRTGSYESVLLTCVAGCLLASALALLVRPERHRDEFVAETATQPVPGG
jgi:MFS family permease